MRRQTRAADSAELRVLSLDRSRLLTVKQQVGLLFESLALFHRLEIFIIEVVPLLIFALCIGHVVPSRQSPMVHSEGEQLIVCTAPKLRIDVSHAELLHV